MSQCYDEDGHADRVSERARQADIILVQRAERMGRVDLKDFFSPYSWEINVAGMILQRMPNS